MNWYIKPGQIEVQLSPRVVAGAARIAGDQYEKFKDYAGAHYKDTHLGHYVGKLGEFAVFNWASIAGLDPMDLFLTDDFREDVFLRMKNLAIEVKTWRQEHWVALGAALNEGQYKKIAKKAHAVVWCVVKSPGVKTMRELQDFYSMQPGGRASVMLMGWNWVGDFQKIPVATRNGLPSRKMPRSQIKPMESL